MNEQMKGAVSESKAAAAQDAGYIEFLDAQNHSLRRAIHAIMKKLAFLLDEDQFADIDSIALAAGAAPVAAAPVSDDGRPMVLVSQEFKAQAEYDAKISSDASNILRDNALGLSGSLPAMVGELLNLASAPAAPGIDLVQFRVSLAYAADVLLRVGNVTDAKVAARLESLLALIDASPKGGGMSDCPIIRLAPGEYTDWEKRVWRRGVIECATQPDIAAAMPPTSHGAGVSDGD